MNKIKKHAVTIVIVAIAVAIALLVWSRKAVADTPVAGIWTPFVVYSVR